MVPKIAMFARFDLTVHTRVVRCLQEGRYPNSAEPSLLVESHMKKGVKQSNKRLIHRAISRTLRCMRKERAQSCGGFYFHGIHADI
jgi:hypothetical protein